MNKRILIIEDNEKQIEVLKGIIKKIDDRIQVYSAQDSASAYKILMENTIDVFLIDIILDTSLSGDTSGMRLAKELRNINRYEFTPVIFITSLEDPRYHAYEEIHAYGYIEKPYDAEYVRSKIEQALHYSTENKQESILYYRKNRILYSIKPDEIIYAESINHVLYLHILGKGVLDIPYKSCKRLIAESNADYLYQCSRNTIVNKKYIQNIDLVNRYITLEENLQAEIGITYVKRVKRDFS